MKTFYTSYYAKNGTHPIAVRVSASAPSFFKGYSYPALYPTWDIIMASKNGHLTFEEYSVEYFKILEQVNPQSVYDQLPDGAVLLCYEKDASECHRTLIGKWLNAHLGVIVEELVESVDKQDKILKLLEID